MAILNQPAGNNNVYVFMTRKVRMVFH